jgi:agmatine/peptidylarginine deiminase
MNNIRIPAEWENQEGVLLTLPDDHTDWLDSLEDVLDCYAHIVSAMSFHKLNVLLLCREHSDGEALIERAENLCSYKPIRENIRLIKANYNDTWIRDYGPISVIKNGELRLLDFEFNGWGLKFASDKDNLVNFNLQENNVFNPKLYRNNRDYTLEGGSIESDGKGTLLTTSKCLCSPNRNGGLSKAQINDILEKRLGAKHVLWLDYGALEGDDTDSHIDTLARLAPDDTIIFTGCKDENDSQFEELLKMRAQLMLLRTAEGLPYNLVELPLPSPIYDDNGERLPATYANYLITPEYIFLPTYAQPQYDMLANMTLQSVFPKHKIIEVDCRALIKQHGSLHCATMQLLPGSLL